MRKSESILERVLFSCSKLVITGQPEIYETNGAEVTPSRFLRRSCFYIVQSLMTFKLTAICPYARHQNCILLWRHHT